MLPIYEGNSEAVEEKEGERAVGFYAEFALVSCWRKKGRKARSPPAAATS